MKWAIRLASKNNCKIQLQCFDCHVRGSFAVVRIATSVKTKTKIVIKEIYTGDLLPIQLEDLEKEMKILSQLQHKNIVRIVEVFKEPSTTYLVRVVSSQNDLCSH
jgi:serine/threonine-protein kinase ULK2